jgi:hypothetical protein
MGCEWRAALALVVTVVLYVSAVANTRAIVKDLRRMQYDRITGLRTALMRRGLLAEEREKLDERIREQNRRTQRNFILA